MSFTSRKAALMHPQPELPSPSNLQRWTIAIAPRTLWQIAGIGIGLWLLLAFLHQIVSTLLLLFIAIVLAEGLRPLVGWLHAKWHLPRAVAVLVLFLILAAALGGIGWALAAPLIAQLTNLLNNLPRYTKDGQHLLNQLQAAVHDNPDLVNALRAAENQAGALAGGLLTVFLGVPGALLRGVFGIVLILTMAFLWLTSIDKLKPFILDLLPMAAQVTAANIMHEASTRIGGYVRGVLIDMVAVGVVSGVGLWLLGVPYALLLGVFAGLTEALPYIGPFIGGGAAILVALFTGGPTKGLEVLIMYEIIQQLEGTLLVPLVMNRTVNLHPLIVVIAVVIGGELLGITGAILAVPLAVLVDIVIARILAPLARRAAARVDGKLNERGEVG